MSGSTKCHHPGFDANVRVDRIEDIGRFMAGIGIKCIACGVPMRFLGQGIGMNYNGARTSVDGTELRIGIHPNGEDVPPVTMEGFNVRVQP